MHTMMVQKHYLQVPSMYLSHTQLQVFFFQLRERHGRERNRREKTKRSRSVSGDWPSSGAW
ncbi:hypothetical protein HanRHA438_Chr04g0156501 [Helianthus annuus]|nr:hypothetical protein HanIR_Chr04g0157581 [Helianthus annuus]KAJ0925163.1 hypothetical protein HanRHA438_Chr04g0156501 [Helianthus annuus]